MSILEPGVAVGTGPRVLDPATVTRIEVVRPSMCGHNSLFVGQIGDWTWDAVSSLCGTDVLRARDSLGASTYLSFYYFRIRGSTCFHLRSPTFGDRLRITSRLFDFGGESVLALHRIVRSQDGAHDNAAPGPIDPDEFYAFGDEDCLYVENFNRWITRSEARSNEDLVRSSPPDFRHRHLPTLPEAYSPRHATHCARTRLTFLDADAAEYRPVGQEVHVNYEIDASRDLNGVGLLYFASYFSIVDWALLRLWRQLGRSDRSFLDRVVVDQQLCCLGNADAGCPVDVALQRWRRVDDDTQEVVDVVLRDRDAGRILAVCTLHLLAEATG
jgi:probable biosynthetic protein (TIGR04098 family)